MSLAGLTQRLLKHWPTQQCVPGSAVSDWRFSLAATDTGGVQSFGESDAEKLWPLIKEAGIKPE
jgi:hypothetical protein